MEDGEAARRSTWWSWIVTLFRRPKKPRADAPWPGCACLCQGGVWDNREGLVECGKFVSDVCRVGVVVDVNVGQQEKQGESFLASLSHAMHLSPFPL